MKKRWLPITGLPQSIWITNRNLAHWALQVPAAFAYQVLPARPDYGQTTFRWAPDKRALLSELSQGSSPLRVGLRIRDLSVVFVDGRGRTLNAFPLVGESLEGGLSKLSEAYQRITGHSIAFVRPDLTLPPHPAAQGTPFESLDPQAADALEAWFNNSTLMLKAQSANLPTNPPVRTWPHHFDTAALYVLDPDEDPEFARSIGLGFSPGDASHEAPYFYILPWPVPTKEDLPPIQAGTWSTEGFVGLQLAEKSDFDSVLQFYEDGTAAVQTLLSKQKARRKLVWYKATAPDELPLGRVKSVRCGRKTVCLTHVADGEGNNTYGALDNRCPHQGGPLGEGTIENGVLRCPWHGWDYDPITGRSVGPYDDGVETFDVEVRDDGIYVGIEEAPKPTRTVSDLMAETMTAWGVNTVFGMVGHSNLGLAEGLRNQENEGKLRYFGIRHEGAASFAASAFGKLTGKPAACLSIAGPGATNLLTGLWDANVDRAPVLALTGQVDTQVMGPGAFQEVDLLSAFGGVAQWKQTVLSDSRHAELMNLAIRSAILNRGVSHLIFPDEVQTHATSKPSGSPEGRLADLGIQPAKSSVQTAANLLASAQRPCIIVGHGARFHMDPILALADRLHAPVLTTFKGKGLVSDDHPLGCGVLGRSGTPIASWFMNEADLLVVFGASFSNHTGITSYKPTIQVDFDAAQLARFHPITVPVLGEIEASLGALHEALPSQIECQDQRTEVKERWRIWRGEKESRAQDDLGKGLNSAVLFSQLTKHAPADAIMPVDVGNNAYSFGRYFEARGQAVVMSGYLGSIGFALPAAMGAWAAATGGDERFSGRPVISISGDGGLAQYMAEMTTLVKYGMNITHIVLNNSELGKISKEQQAGEWPIWQTSLVNPNFADFAQSCGAYGARVTDLSQLEDALSEGIQTKGPALVEVMTDAELL